MNSETPKTKPVVSCPVLLLALLLLAACSGSGAEDGMGDGGGLNAEVGPTMQAVAESRPCVVLNWDEAQAASTFELVTPDVIPEGFALTGYALEELPAPGSDMDGCDTGVNRVQMEFQSAGGDSHSIMLAQMTPLPQTWVERIRDHGKTIGGKQAGRRIEETGTDAELVRFAWISDDVFFTLSGPTGAEDDLVEILESMPG